jgi:hypothetical protein
MRALALAVMLAAASPAPQPDLSRCRFRDVVHSPGEAPAVLDTRTVQHARFENVLQPVDYRVLKAWLRVSADGRVTDVCVPDAPEGFEAPIAKAARSLRYTPARDGGRAVATIVAFPYEIGGRYERQQPRLTEIGTSTEVGWLERIARSADAATEAWRAQWNRMGHPRDLRIAAFARLGELGTRESLAAQQRIQAALAARSMVAYSLPLDTDWPHAAWHMSAQPPAPIARAQTRDGGWLALIAVDLLGPPQVFVLECEDDRLSRCSRPKPAVPWRWRSRRTNVSLTEVGAGRFRLDVVPLEPERPAAATVLPTRQPRDRVRPEPPPPERHDIVLADVNRDSDADGWTDIEERTLGLDPARRDSDADGVEDAHDRAPLSVGFAAANEDTEILQQAIFAAFGLSESRWALFAHDERVPRLDIPGLPAPVIFHRPLPADTRTERPGGVFVSWTIVRKSATEALVAISDWVSPTGAGGQHVFLRRIGNRWVVIARQTTRLS